MVSSCACNLPHSPSSDNLVNNVYKRQDIFQSSLTQNTFKSHTYRYIGCLVGRLQPQTDLINVLAKMSVGLRMTMRTTDVAIEFIPSVFQGVLGACHLLGFKFLLIRICFPVRSDEKPAFQNLKLAPYWSDL